MKINFKVLVLNIIDLLIYGIFLWQLWEWTNVFMAVIFPIVHIMLESMAMHDEDEY